jgi:hypothetical protein
MRYRITLISVLNPKAHSMLLNLCYIEFGVSFTLMWSDQKHLEAFTFSSLTKHF